jgi:hypothetical protein
VLVLRTLHDSGGAAGNFRPQPYDLLDIAARELTRSKFQGVLRTHGDEYYISRNYR